MIFLTDLHLDTFRQWSSLRDGVNTRLLDQINVISEVGKKIQSSGEKHVVFLGDLINSFSDYLPKVVYNAAWYALHTWSEDATVYVIVGNHDIYRNMHIFDPFRDMPNVIVITRPTSIEIEGYEVDMVPWGSSLPERRGDVLASHLDIKGGIMNASGIHSTDGMHPMLLKGYKYVFLGHYHEAQTIPVPGAKWAGYVGSLMQTDLTLSVANKGITHFNSGEVRFEEISSPKIFSVTVETQEQLDKTVESISKGHNYWKIIVKDSSITVPIFDYKVQVEYDVEKIIESRLVEKPGEPLMDTVLRFIESVDTKVDKDAVKDLLGEVLV